MHFFSKNILLPCEAHFIIVGYYGEYFMSYRFIVIASTDIDFACVRWRTAYIKTV